MTAMACNIARIADWLDTTPTPRTLCLTTTPAHI
jgi:hypothetical protein